MQHGSVYTAVYTSTHKDKKNLDIIPHFPIQNVSIKFVCYIKYKHKTAMQDKNRGVY